jgi:hypothetical protein
VAEENIGGIWNVKQPGYDDKADIQAALKLFLYGDYNFNTDASESSQKAALATNNGIARHLQDLKNRIEDQEELGIGSDYLTVSAIQSLSNPTDGFIAMASDSTGAAVQSTYGIALYQNDEPTTNLIDGIVWIDKNSENKDVYVYDDNNFVKVGTYTEAKGDLIVGASEGVTQILPIGDNGKILTADSSAPLGVSWIDPDYENNKNIASIYFGDYSQTSLIGIAVNGVAEDEILQTIDNDDLELAITKSASSTKTKINFTGVCRPTTDTNTEAFIGLQRKINTGAYSTINIGLVSKEFTSLHFEWLDTHGATTGDVITYRLINITPNGYSPNVITQRFGETSDTFIVEEI